VKFHFTKECVERDDIELEHVGTGDELADVRTKALGRVHFQELRERVGVKEVCRSSHRSRGRLLVLR
jgi:hypothetical protein